MSVSTTTTETVVTLLSTVKFTRRLADARAYGQILSESGDFVTVLQNGVVSVYDKFCFRVESRSV